MNQLQAVIFDMDGVLVNSQPIYQEADRKMFHNLGIELTADDVIGLVGINTTAGARLILERHPELHLSVDELDKIYQNSLLNSLQESSDLTLIPGVLNWIKELKKLSLKLAVASSSTAPMVEHIMNRFGLLDYMETVISGQMVLHAKPAPEIFLKAAHIMGVSPSHCAVIEDSTNGITAAKAAGMYCLAFTGANVHHLDNSHADAHFNAYNSQNFSLLVAKN